MTDVDTLAELIRSALTLDEKVRDGNAGPLAALSDLAALARDNAAVREKMMHNAANLDFAIKQREAAEADRARLHKMWLSQHNRVTELEAVIAWVLQHGEQGKQSRRRLKAALAGDGGGA